MKKIFIGLAGLTILLIAFAAFAYSSGTPVNNTGQMSAQRQNFLKETKDLRRAKHDLRCELQAASQGVNPDSQQIAGMKKEIAVLRQEIQAKATELGVTTGGGSGQNRPLNCSGATQGRMVRQ